MAASKGRRSRPGGAVASAGAASANRLVVSRSSSGRHGRRGGCPATYGKPSTIHSSVPSCGVIVQSRGTAPDSRGSTRRLRASSRYAALSSHPCSRSSAGLAALTKIRRPSARSSRDAKPAVNPLPVEVACTTSLPAAAAMAAVTGGGSSGPPASVRRGRPDRDGHAGPQSNVVALPVRRREVVRRCVMRTDCGRRGGSTATGLSVRVGWSAADAWWVSGGRQRVTDQGTRR